MVMVSVYKVSVSARQSSPFKYHNASDFGSETEFDAYINEVKKRELFDIGVEATFGDKLLSLSTCEYSQPGGRLVVLAKRVSEQ